jgi:hypothetical protein
MIRAAESVFSGEKLAMTSAANGFDRAMLRLAERITEKQHSLPRLRLHESARIRADALKKM